MRTCIARYTSFTFSIALIETFEDIVLLAVMKKQLQSIIRMRIVYGGNRLFSARRLHEEKPNPDRPAVTVEMKLLVDKLAARIGFSEEIELEQTINQFLKKLTELQSVSEMEYILQYFIAQMYRIYVQEEQTGMILSEMDDLIETIRVETNYNLLKVKLKALLLRLHRRLVEFHLAQKDDPVEKAKAWIHDHLGDKITIPELSEHVYLYPTYFCNIFKKQTGKTVLEYITEARMTKAKELLQDPTLKVNDVAEMLGYQDTKYFSRLFKQRWGSLPSAYRKQSIVREVTP